VDKPYIKTKESEIIFVGYFDAKT